MQWFRVYSDVVDDPKIQRLSGDSVKSWLNLLCLCSRNGGNLPAMQDVAWSLRMTSEKAEQVVVGLVDHGLFDRLDCGVIRAHNWDTRQYASDNSTRRVKAHRSMKQADVPERNGDETFQETGTKRFMEQPRNVSVTPSEQNRTDTDAEQILPPLPPLPVRRGLLADEDKFDDFRALATEAGMDGSTRDWGEARIEWRRLDWTQRLAATDGIKARSKTTDPCILALPQNYLRKRMWERKLRTSSDLSEAQKLAAEIEERQSRFAAATRGERRIEDA